MPLGSKWWDQHNLYWPLLLFRLFSFLYSELIPERSLIPQWEEDRKNGEGVVNVGVELSCSGFRS